MRSTLSLDRPGAAAHLTVYQRLEPAALAAAEERAPKLAGRRNAANAEEDADGSR
jgi:hypothetical protein